MKLRLMCAGLIGGLAFNLSGCQSATLAPNDPLAMQPNQKIDTQIVPPGDAATIAAMKEALTGWVSVTKIHACIKDEGSLRLLNQYAVPGVNIVNMPMYFPFPNSAQWLPYHDRNKCVSTRMYDQWEMPALNALSFRVVYYADDSGETVNFAYHFKKVDDGSWKLESFNRTQ